MSMKSILHFYALVVCSLLVSCMTDKSGKSASQLDCKSAGAAAEAFLAGYIMSDARNSEWVANSPLVTTEFKATFKRAMKLENWAVDPVIFAQDIPTTPFKAESSTVKGGTATVLVAAKFSDHSYKLKVMLVAKDGHWLVSKTAPVK